MHGLQGNLWVGLVVVRIFYTQYTRYDELWEEPMWEYFEKYFWQQWYCGNSRRPKQMQHTLSSMAISCCRWIH
jgi:hypothetical protein